MCHLSATPATFPDPPTSRQTRHLKSLKTIPSVEYWMTLRNRKHGLRSHLSLTTKLRVLVALLMGCHSRSRFLLGGMWKIFRVIGRRRHTWFRLERSITRGFGRNCALSGTNIFTCLCAVITSILLGSLSGPSGVMSSYILDLTGLGVDDVGSVRDLAVNEIFVGDIDQWSKVQNRYPDKREAPEWKKLDKPIGCEGSEECLAPVSCTPNSKACQ